ncbi:hypothetical protein EDC94DRAFT_96306 [Helicostylum pulchrum]|nr:hypothetical protein EDC94DRAFT_96306 [Helicostylum pulchrum]
MSLSSEIRHDIIELFPTLLNKEIYFKLVKEIHLPTTTQEVLNNDIYQKEYRWKIHFSILKRLDSIDRDWNIRPQPLLHQLPILYLEQPINLFCNTVNKWNHKEKLTYFPMIETIQEPQHEHFITRYMRAVQLSSTLVDTLNALDKLTMITNPVINHTTPIVSMDDNPTTPISAQNYTSQFNTFLPQKKLDDFKVIQTCLKDNRRTTRVCELDNFRFQFD